MYEEWLKESEKVDPQATPAASPTTPPAPSADVPPAGDIPLEVSPEGSTEPTSDSTSEPASEQEEFEQIDTTRRDAIKAFKDKQKEYMEIPIEIRNSPTTDEDKTKVESLKAELQTLNTAMKDAVAAYDAFNDKMLGASSDANEEP
jgi:hypothetical protein